MFKKKGLCAFFNHFSTIFQLFYTNPTPIFESLLHKSYTSLTPIQHKSCERLTPFYTNLTPSQHKSYTSLAKVLHQSNTNLTPIQHKSYESLAKVLHKSYTSLTPIQHQSNTRLAKVLFICLAKLLH